jgi:hypothetical protein
MYRRSASAGAGLVALEPPVRVRQLCAALAVIVVAACAPRLDSARYASDQPQCPPVHLPSADDLAKLPTETVRMRAQRADVERQTFLVSGGQTCLGTGTHAEAWSSLLRQRTGDGR